MNVKKSVYVVTLVALLLALLALGGTARAEPTAVLSLSRSVIGGGGGQNTGSEHYLGGTVGQAVVGLRGTASHDLCAGFWCGLGRYEVYLPLVLREM
ncbi:MAG: hypothetical protein JXD18_10785 [Anaerolineae bacterium]|nr:hypothetical protein [Anaerolineae bacterium]